MLKFLSTCLIIAEISVACYAFYNGKGGILLNDDIGHLIKIVDEQLKKRFDKDLQKFDLTLSQMRVLWFLKSKGGRTSQKDIEDFLQVSHPTVVGLISRLKEMREHSGIFLFDPREPEEDAGSKGSIHLHFNLSIANRNIPDHKQHTGEIYQVFEFLGIQISLVLPFATQEPPELITRQQLVCSLEFPSRIQPTTEVFETADKAQLSDHIVNLPVLQVEILPFARIELHAARHTLQPFLPDLDTTETEQKVSADLSVAIEVGTDEIQHITQLILG